MSYQEKSAWACVLSILVVFTPYFFVVFWYPLAHVGLFAITVALLVAMLVAFHTVNSITTAPIRKSGDVPAPDELDHIIELRAAKLAGIVLATVVLCWSIATMFGAPAQGVIAIASERAAGDLATSSSFAIPVSQALFWVHLLFAGFVVSNIAYYTAIVAGYRRLSNG